MKKLINALLKKYSIEALAEACGYTTTQSIRSIATGLTSMPIYKQKKLSKALNIPLSRLKNAHISDIKGKY